MTLHPGLIVPAVGFVVIDTLAGVLDDPRALTDAAGGEDAAAVDVGGADDVEGIATTWGH
ncbi:MAG TPA: hypothetical protein VJZ25_04050 [Gemmatimonadaceae bacterium]|nr:hypothetical protein [Gemmatimonadaceae bacterium]